MYNWIIIDGNNLVHSDREGLFGNRRADFASARRGLARLIGELGDELAERVTIVFDGTAGGRAEALQAPGLEVLFSPSSQSADSVIERMVSKAPSADGILVVTSDRGERFTVGAAGAMTMSCDNFIDLLKDCRKAVTRKLNPRRRPPSGPSLGDFFPT